MREEEKLNQEVLMTQREFNLFFGALSLGFLLALILVIIGRYYG